MLFRVLFSRVVALRVVFLNLVTKCVQISGQKKDQQYYWKLEKVKTSFVLHVYTVVRKSF